MAKVRKTYRYIRIDPPKEFPSFSEEKRKNLKELVKSYGLKVKNVSNSTRAEPGGFAHGGTFYSIDILSVDPPSVFIEDDNFYQYGISYTRPNLEWETFVEGASSETLKGGVDEWVKNPYHEANDEGEYIYTTLVLDKDSRPDMFETDDEGNFVVSWKIVPIFS